MNINAAENPAAIKILTQIGYGDSPTNDRIEKNAQVFKYKFKYFMAILAISEFE